MPRFTTIKRYVEGRTHGAFTARPLTRPTAPPTEVDRLRRDNARLTAQLHRAHADYVRVRTRYSGVLAQLRALRTPQALTDALRLIATLTQERDDARAALTQRATPTPPRAATRVKSEPVRALITRLTHERDAAQQALTDARSGGLITRAEHDAALRAERQQQERLRELDSQAYEKEIRRLGKRLSGATGTPVSHNVHLRHSPQISVHAPQVQA